MVGLNRESAKLHRLDVAASDAGSVGSGDADVDIDAPRAGDMFRWATACDKCSEVLENLRPFAQPRQLDVSGGCGGGDGNANSKLAQLQLGVGSAAIASQRHFD